MYQTVIDNWYHVFHPYSVPYLRHIHFLNVKTIQLLSNPMQGKYAQNVSRSRLSSTENDKKLNIQSAHCKLIDKLILVNNWQ